MNPADIHSLLQIAVNAPSGHNFQPWKFTIENNALYLSNIPERDTSIFNFRQRGSFLALGALTENIVLLALSRGYETQVRTLADNRVQITFAPTSPKEGPLAKAIPLRTTNRKAFKKTPLDSAHKNAILQAGSGTLRLIEDKKAMNDIAKAWSVNEKLLVKNPSMHSAVFSHILWTEKEHEEKILGLYIKTLELPPPAQIIFRLLKNWNIARILGKLGIGNFIASQNAKVYASASAHCVLAVPTDTPAEFILAGRILERIWLTATSCGLSLQPVTAIPYLAQRVHENDASMFSPAEIDMIKHANDMIRKAFSIPQETIAMTFRIGYDSSPSAHSLKAPPLIG